VTAVVAQRLVRRQCPHCRADDTPKPEQVRALAIPRDELAGYAVVHGRGCAKCLYTGYRGRVGLYEMLMMTDALRDGILQKLPSHELRRIAMQSPNFMSLQEDGIAKALQGKTTFKEVLENVPRAKQIRPLAQLLEPYA
jgi:type IV pilus assembly protein PilB